MITEIYYEYCDDFDGAKSLENEMPRDVKRLISHCRHTHHNRMYFFSPSEKQFYMYFPKSEYAEKLGGYRVSKRSLQYQFIPDDDDSTHSTPNIRDAIVVSGQQNMHICAKLTGLYWKNQIKTALNVPANMLEAEFDKLRRKKSVQSAIENRVYQVMHDFKNNAETHSYEELYERLVADLHSGLG